VVDAIVKSGCAAAAARLPDRPEVGTVAKSPGPKNTSSATRTRATRARSWTAACWKAIRTACSRAWSSPATASARTRASSTARRVSPRHQPPAERHPPGQAGGAAGQRHLRVAHQLQHRHPHRRRRVRLRRGDGPDGLGRGQARHAAPAPAFPAERGLFDCPTLINNVETFANVAPILRRGVDWFTGIGTDKSKGTKVFALAGKIQNTGLIEVPMGTRSATIVEQMGAARPTAAGSRPCRRAARPAAASPCSTPRHPVDYESLTQLGSIMGSGA